MPVPHRMTSIPALFPIYMSYMGSVFHSMLKGTNTSVLSVQAVGADLTPERQQAWKEWLSQYKAALKAEGQSDEQRVQMQNSANPCYIPRNHLLQTAIEQAEAGDFAEVQTLIPSDNHDT